MLESCRPDHDTYIHVHRYKPSQTIPYLTKKTRLKTDSIAKPKAPGEPLGLGGRYLGVMKVISRGIHWWGMDPGVQP